MKKYYIWLLLVFGYANPIVTELLERFETAEGIFSAFRSNIAAAGAEYAGKAAETSLESAEKTLSELESKGYSVITIEDKLYPDALKETENPPCVIFARGNTALLSEKLVTIGGSRKISSYTIAAETEICTKLCQKYTLVASLGTGCEQLACLTAMKCGKGCIEVLPCGFDREYPNGSDVMRQQLLMNGGCIITEFLPDVKSSNANYIRRGRISGGISKAMIVFQARIGSGSLNAAKYSPALFFLPPHDVFSAEYAGAVQCVRNGAGLYLSEQDIDDVFKDGFTPRAVEIKIQKKPAAQEKPKEEKAPGKSVEPDSESFETPVHFSVYNRIRSAESITFDEIYRSEEVEISDLSEILLDLEIEGRIKAMPGNRYMAL